MNDDIMNLEQQIMRAFQMKKIKNINTGLQDNWIKILTEKVKNKVDMFCRLTIYGKIVCIKDGEEYMWNDAI